MLFKCKFYYYLLNSPKSKRRKKSKIFSKFKIPMPQQFLNNQTDQAGKKKIKPSNTSSSTKETTKRLDNSKKMVGVITSTLQTWRFFGPLTIALARWSLKKTFHICRVVVLLMFLGDQKKERSVWQTKNLHEKEKKPKWSKVK